MLYVIVDDDRRVLCVRNNVTGEVRILIFLSYYAAYRHAVHQKYEAMVSTFNDSATLVRKYGKRIKLARVYEEDGSLLNDSIALANLY